VYYGGYQIVACFKSLSLAFDFAFLLLILLVSTKSKNRKIAQKFRRPKNTHQTKTSSQKFTLAHTNPKQPKANAKKEQYHRPLGLAKLKSLLRKRRRA